MDTKPPRLRIAVFGAGALGLYFAGRLSQAEHFVTLVVRPGSAHHQSVLIEEQGRNARCEGIVVAPANAPTPQDIVIAAIKAHQLPAALPALQGWLGDNTQLILTQNGLPWWYFDGAEAPLAGHALRAADPDGSLARTIDLRRTIGCVVHKSAERRSPGHVVAVHAPGDRLVLGRPLGGEDEILRIVTGILRRAGLKAECTAELRPAIWEKLLGNVVLNPLSAITGLDIGGLLGDPENRRTILGGMNEAYGVALAFGVQPGATPKERLQRMKAVAASHGVRTSMLQDRLAGRDLEIEPIVGTVLELARLKKIPTPYLTWLYEGVRALSQTPSHESTRKIA